MKIYRSLLISCILMGTKNIIVRKDIRDMSELEWAKYKGAVMALHKSGMFENFSRMHKVFEKYAHNDPRFLPWHRMFLEYFESYVMQHTGDTTMGVPYWDWREDSDNPAESYIFTEKYWGFKDCFEMGYPKKHCLKRNKEIKPWSSALQVRRLLRRGCSYDEFRFILEALPHGLVHANIGGDMGHMQAPNDPIFWHHHSFIDYLWTKRGERYSGQGYDKRTRCDINEKLFPFNRRIREVLKHREIKYQDYSGKNKNSTGGASELPEDYALLHGFAINKIRKAEKI
ncbi:tyrosinase [Enteropsectra breve]|nr:tyrosinase [Enteropsectra breve]